MIDLLALQEAWCRDTGAGTSGLSGMPVGQCAVTALLVQDLLGGELVRAELRRVTFGGRLVVESHYWNRIQGMGDIDLTRAQYAGETLPLGDVVPRSRLLEGDRALAARTPERYALLKRRYEASTRT